MTTEGDAEPTHTQTNTLFPTCDEVVNLTGLLETKVMSVSSGKQYSTRWSWRALPRRPLVMSLFMCVVFISICLCTFFLLAGERCESVSGAISYNGSSQREGLGGYDSDIGEELWK
jgi:hypothetical protein